MYKKVPITLDVTEISTQNEHYKDATNENLDQIMQISAEQQEIILNQNKEIAFLKENLSKTAIYMEGAIKASIIERDTKLLEHIRKSQKEEIL